MSIISLSDKAAVRGLLRKLEEGSFSHTDSSDLNRFLRKYSPAMIQAAQIRLGVSITNILYFFTEEELLDIKEIATKINGKAVVDPNRTDRWYQLSQLLLERMVAASGESLAEEDSLPHVVEDNSLSRMYDNGSTFRRK